MRDAWLVGTSATRAERLLVYAGGAIAAAAVWWMFLRPQADWAWWQQVVAILIALDLCSGAIANAANSTKAQYEGTAPTGRLGRIAREPIAFAALHIYPLLIAALYPGVDWGWGFGWYLAMLASMVLLTRGVPRYLQRPTAMTLFLVVVVVALAVPGPAGWQWLPLVYFAKLILGHAVAEQPIRAA